MTNPTLYLIRHATPDWSRTDIPYHIPPGPSLTPQGEEEARELARFLNEAGVGRLYSSPLERCLSTAHIAAEQIGSTVEVDSGLTEWAPNEKSEVVHARLWPIWERAVAAAESGPVALITHGGPIALLLAELGLTPEAINHYKRIFDRNNPLPPAGAWQAARNGEGWALNLAFTPEAYRAKLFV
ncbi:MAG TPA: histidine phosphatase family protein [Anaerolineales bacterium]|nr:histidine phosphatase family protein [Anaerolineales bacterium]